MNQYELYTSQGAHMQWFLKKRKKKNQCSGVHGLVGVGLWVNQSLYPTIKGEMLFYQSKLPVTFQVALIQMGARVLRVVRHSYSYIRHPQSYCVFIILRSNATFCYQYQHICTCIHFSVYLTHLNLPIPTQEVHAIMNNGGNPRGMKI